MAGGIHSLESIPGLHKRLKIRARMARHTIDSDDYRVHTHRVAMTAFWRPFYHAGKFSPGWWGWGCMPTPISLYCIYHHIQSCSVRWEGRYMYTLLVFHLFPICALWWWVMTIQNQKGRESTPYVPLIFKGSFIYEDRLLNNGIRTVFCTL